MDDHLMSATERQIRSYDRALNKFREAAELEARKAQAKVRPKTTQETHTKEVKDDGASPREWFDFALDSLRNFITWESCNSTEPRWSAVRIPMEEWAERFCEFMMSRFHDAPSLFQSSASDGSSATYYELPEGATQLQHLISHRNMNAQIGEMFRTCYRYGQAPHSSQMREMRKVIFYAQAELERLQALADHADS